MMATDWRQRDPLDAAAIRAALTARGVERPLEVHQQLPSTHDRVRELAGGGAPPGTAVIADAQTAGRGRHGRSWHSPPGLGLYLSVLVEPHRLGVGLLMLSAAVAVRRAIVAAGGPTATVKWPNDLEVGGRKVCGILCEAWSGRHGALGIGINVHHADRDLPPELAGRAMSLDAMAGAPVVRNALAAQVLAELAECEAALARGHGAAWLHAWRAACSHLGRRVTVTSGESMLAGTALDVDRDGALRLRLDDGRVQRVLAGQLRVVGGERAPDHTERRRHDAMPGL
ncbi:MAG: biotin--[acetyl-CoA-carboxylase] ligase [Candidatus Eiseniibacteriota bacterium]|jgi:BirA family biotin operon repressor/biotin-[acetyl-CoA-carboxylase] ligase